MTTTTLPTDTPVLSPSPPRRRWLRVLIAIPIIVIGLVLLFVGGVFVIAASNYAPVPSAPVVTDATRFDGRTLIVASDADMVGTAYADSLLMQMPGDTDTLSLIELPVTDANVRVIPISVSNAVTSWPQITAVSPDGMQVYVVETSAPIEDTVTQQAAASFPPGQTLTRIDLSAGADNAITNTVDLGRQAIHVGISRDGAFLAVGTREPGQVILVPTATWDDPATHRVIDMVNAEGAAAREVTAVSWHPSGRYLAVGIDGRDVRFFRVNTSAEGGITLEPFGARLALGNRITYGQFTNDGRFFLTAELNWNVYPGLLGPVLNPPGDMISVAFDEQSSGHREVSRVQVGQSPEGFAVSQQEDLITTVNMNRTYLPDGLTWIPGSTINSLSLLSFDNQTGALAVVGEPYGFEGVLPEAAMFDADGDSLAVVIYNERENPMNPGYVEFWNVIRDGDAPRLERTSVRVPVVRGGHAMNFIP